MKDIRTDVCEGVSTTAAAVIDEARERVDPHHPEGFLDDDLAIKGVFTEPGNVSARGMLIVDIIKEFEGFPGKDLGTHGGDEDIKFLFRRAVFGESPLVVDAGDSEVTREGNLSNILNSGVEVFGGAINIDIGEEAQWLNGVVSSTRLSEVVRGGD